MILRKCCRELFFSQLAKKIRRDLGKNPDLFEGVEYSLKVLDEIDEKCAGESKKVYPDQKVKAEVKKHPPQTPKLLS